MPALFTNNASTTLASSILSTDLSLTVATGTGTKFPSPTGSQFFYATLVQGSTVEIVKVTTRATDTFTIVRAQDGTTAAAFTFGATVELRLVTADLNNFRQSDVPLTTGSSILYGDGAGSFSNATVGTGLSFSTGTLTATGIQSIGVTAPVASSGGTSPTISMAAATTSVNGYLTSTDWNTFNNKQPAGAYLTGNQTITFSGGASGSGTTAVTLTLGNTAVTGQAITGFVSGAGTVSATDTILTAINKIDGNVAGKQAAGTYVTSVGATAPVASSGGTAPTISMAAATTSVSGYLTSTDWNTFNGKQAALGFTPYNSTNPSGYITSSASITGTSGGLTGTPNISVGTIAAGVTTITGGATQPLKLSTSSAGPWAIELNRSDLAQSSRVYNGTGTQWYFEHRPSFVGNTPLDSGNYTSYAPSLTGSGASGTWGINVTGSAGSASTATTSSLLANNATGIYATSSGTAYTNAVCVRELNLGGAQGNAFAAAPRLGFHWGGVVASQIAMETSGRIGIWNNPGTAFEAFGCAALTATSGSFSSTISASNFSGSSSGTNTGDQTNISGNAATATTASACSGNAASATTDAQHFGVSQTWQAVTRTSGTTYTNSTGRPITFQAGVMGTGAGVGPTLTIGGVVVSQANMTANAQATLSGVIPNGVSYSWNSVSHTVLFVVELR